MLDPAVIDAGPSRFSRALGVLIVGALAVAIAPSTLVPDPPRSVAKQTACEFHRERVRARASIETRAPGVSPRYLQRELGHGAALAR
jgi:hypothetical protein